MRVLYLSPRESWPANSGAKLRDLYLARGLAQRASVEYLFFGSEDAAVELRKDLGSARAVPTPKKYTPGKLLRGLMGSTPLPVLNYTSAEMTRAVELAASSEPFDVVHLDSIHMAAYLDVLRAKLPGAQIALDWHNIESEAMERFAEQTSSKVRAAYARYTARGLKRLEDEMLAGLHGHLVCSERERTLLLQRAPQARIAVVENGVDAARFVGAGDSGARGRRLVFVGQMSYRPNAEGAVWFVRSIWPELRKRWGDLELAIVGADPAASVQALAGEPGVTVTGTVPDVRPYYEGALAAIVPLLSGAGTRLKILEAMAARTPVISTALGAEGLAVEDGVHFARAESAADWVRALGLVQNEAKVNELVRAGRQLVAQRYDWPILGAKLAELYGVWSSDSKKNKL